MTYPETLSAAWQEHLAHRNGSSPTVISLFAGTGGSSLGYSMAGFRELLAVEFDPHAVEMFRLNFPEVSVFDQDIHQLTDEKCLELAKLKSGELDVLDGSPPCQGFSLTGPRREGDSRNQLFVEYVRLLRALKPKVFLMENVAGMVSGKTRKIFVEILKQLKESGYRVSARLLNAMYFNVPQDRRRLIFIGTREDLNVEPSHPKAQSWPVTMQTAIIDADLSGTPELIDEWKSIYGMIPRGDDAGALLNSHFSSKRPNLDTPSRTLTKMIGGKGFCTLFHPIESRSLSIGEIKRIGSFPDEFRLTGSFKDQWARIGNSVPPLFMRALARHIRTTILDKAR